MSYTSWYERISRPFRGYLAGRILNVLDFLLVIVVAVAYLATLVYLLVTGSPHFPKALIVPAITFMVVTALRAVLDFPRPYEAFAINPIIEKSTLGKSCPSRHMSSAVVIACMFAWLSPIAGVVAGIACVLIAFTRIVGGVHFPRDIVLATALALVCGIVGFFVIP